MRTPTCPSSQPHDPTQWSQYPPHTPKPASNHLPTTPPTQLQAHPSLSPQYHCLYQSYRLHPTNAPHHQPHPAHPQALNPPSTSYPNTHPRPQPHQSPGLPVPAPRPRSPQAGGVASPGALNPQRKQRATPHLTGIKSTSAGNAMARGRGVIGAVGVSGWVLICTPFLRRRIISFN